MKTVILKSKKPIYAWIDGIPSDDQAMQQVENIANMPFLHHHVALMPDYHYGKGATIGSVIATYNAIIPAAVGVDLYCGVLAAKTNLKADKLPDNLALVRSKIEQFVPHGRTNDGGIGDKGAWADTPQSILDAYKTAQLHEQSKYFSKKYQHLEKYFLRATSQIGTLGTGNHFIEICIDKNSDVWILLHSGSRGVGNAIGTFFINKAKEEMKRWHINLPDENLAYLPEGSVYYNDYVSALLWCEKYASLNRKLMLESTLQALKIALPSLEVLIDETVVSCHHNYVSFEKHYGKDVVITRKGAVNAEKDKLGIILGSMGNHSYIVKGKGNKESFCTCSHGAGRHMSRTDARKIISLEDHIRDTAKVECRKDIGVLDESPKAYKDIKSVMAAQEDLVEIVNELKQIVCVKG